jgi:hypothetical protein
MTIDLHKWKSYSSGGFVVSVVFIMIVLGLNSNAPSSATPYLIGLLSLMGAVSLAGWGWCAFRIFEQHKDRWWNKRR